jgi:hypothetical protein
LGKIVYWFGKINDTKLKATLGVIFEPFGRRSNRFHVITSFYYRRWTEPVYFNLIRLFHHLIVGSLAKAAGR